MKLLKKHDLDLLFIISPGLSRFLLILQLQHETLVHRVHGPKREQSCQELTETHQHRASGGQPLVALNGTSSILPFPSISVRSVGRCGLK